MLKQKSPLMVTLLIGVVLMSGCSSSDGFSNCATEEVLVIDGYERLKANGKHTTQAQIAVMRKLVITAHSLYKNNRKYDVEFNTQRRSKVA